MRNDIAPQKTKDGNPNQTRACKPDYNGGMPREQTLNPVDKALWYIESHFAGDLTLEGVATKSGVSRFHMTRAFDAATGYPIMRYVRGRRLTEAARALANGAPDILGVALEAGYNSHEAFTRAFRDQFGMTPETVRAQRNLANIALVEAITMDQTVLEKLDSPRFENAKAFCVAGLAERCDNQSSAGIPAQWQRFQPYIGNIPGQVGSVAYGVIFNGDDEGNVDYLCGVEVTDYSKVSSELSRVRIPEDRYAVFSHREHVASIRRTFNTIWSKWFPESGHEPADAPFFERYDEHFNPATGLGGLEIWIPLKQ
jgi:AraC family transcriptional regulator